MFATFFTNSSTTEVSERETPHLYSSSSFAIINLRIAGGKNEGTTHVYRK